MRPFLFVQIKQIAGDELDKGRYEGKNIHFPVKVIVQGQGHQEAFFPRNSSWEHLPEIEGRNRNTR